MGMSMTTGENTMLNYERAKQAYEFEQFVREVFEKCRALLLGPRYNFDKYEMTEDAVEITGYDDRYGGDWDSFTIPYADLDDIDAFLIKQQAEIAEEKRRVAEKQAAEQAQKKVRAEETERQQYLKLKEKYEGVNRDTMEGTNESQR